MPRKKKEQPKKEPKVPAKGRNAKGQFTSESCPDRGRAKMPDELRKAFRDASEDARKVLISIMKSPEAKDADRIRAAEVILDRGYGKPVQAVDVDGNMPAPVMIIGDVLD